MTKAALAVNLVDSTTSGVLAGEAFSTRKSKLGQKKGAKCTRHKGGRGRQKKEKKRNIAGWPTTMLEEGSNNRQQHEDTEEIMPWRNISHEGIDVLRKELCGKTEEEVFNKYKLRRVKRVLIKDVVSHSLTHKLFCASMLPYAFISHHLCHDCHSLLLHFFFFFFRSSCLHAFVSLKTIVFFES